MEGAGRRYPPAARLRKAPEFRQVQQQASVRVRASCLMLLARPNLEGRPRLGLAISKRHAGNAVQRNLIKRIVRESFRLWQQRLPPMDIVVIAQPGARSACRTSLHCAAEQLWHALNKRAYGS